MNVSRLLVGAGNGNPNVVDSAIANTYGNSYYIPLEFELLQSHMPFYQSVLGGRLEYELTFNDYSRVTVAPRDASHGIENISLD